jgi:hypothetical protein
MREYHYVIDREGRIIHDGTEIVDAPTLRFFLKTMERTPDDRWLVVCQRERNWFETPDTPFVVQRLRLDVTGQHLRTVELCFAGDLREPLDPATLESEGGILFCRIRSGTVRARFGRVAMQQLSPYLREHYGAVEIAVGDRAYPIAEVSPVRRSAARS